MKRILFCLGFLIAGLIATAQDTWRNIVEDEMPKDLRMSCILWQLGEYAKTEPQAARDLAVSKKMVVRDDGKINAELVFGSDATVRIDMEFLNSLGVEIGTTWRNRANVWLHPNEFIPTGEKMSAGYLLKSVSQPVYDNEGPGLTNSVDFANNGADGSGIRIAIIDGGFQQLATAQATGAAPAVTQYNWTTGSIAGNTPHGTGCLETAFDHAPGATFFIHRVSTITDLGQAVDQAIDDNVDIISHSRSHYNEGWADNTGGACAAANEAVADGMLFFTAVGNRNGQHWQGILSDPDGDDWHNWSGTDEANNIVVDDGGYVQLYLSWNADPDPVHDDYDLYLYRTSNDDVIESSTSGWSFEDIIWENNTGAALAVYVAVRQDGDDVNTFELFNHPRGCTDFQFASTSNSNTTPSNSTQANVISVGAVYRSHYNDPPGTTGIIEDYSSRGPTNSGNIAPDIVAPTGTTTVAYGGDFTGTSCSTPNAAGTAAAFWSEHIYLSASGVRMLLFRQSYLYNDWGSGGSDNIYGRGGVEIYDWVNNSRFIYHGGGNTTGVSSLPYYTIEQADAEAPVGVRMIFLGETIAPPPPASNVLDKEMIYMSPIRDSYIKN